MSYVDLGLKEGKVCMEIEYELHTDIYHKEAHKMHGELMLQRVFIQPWRYSR